MGAGWTADVCVRETARAACGAGKNNHILHGYTNQVEFSSKKKSGRIVVLQRLVCSILAKFTLAIYQASSWPPVVFLQ